MNRFLFLALSLPLAACYDGLGERGTTGQCPAGETCSDTTPNGLEFIGNSFWDVLFETGPHPTAIGGTQVITLQGSGLTTDYLADDEGGLGVRVASRNGFDLTMWGVGSRSNYLRILDGDGLLMDRKELTGAALDRIELIQSVFETIPADREVVLMSGERSFGIALYGDVQHDDGPVSERIVDSSMQLALDGAERVAWDALKVTLTPGTHSLAVIAGDKPATNLDVIAVDHADSVSVQAGQPTTIPPNQYTTVCFEALSAGRYIAQAHWDYTVDGEPSASLISNCVDAHTTKTSGTVTVEATAAGATTSITLSVVQQLRAKGEPAPAIRARATAIPTAGDRAAM